MLKQKKAQHDAGSIGALTFPDRSLSHLIER
jgi:hypothetical protein